MWDGQPLSLSGAAIRVTLTDWSRDAAQGRHFLLINRADASLQDIPLVHYDSGHRRMAGKEIREGIDLSCHVLIQESEDARKPALMLMTNGTSLSADKVCQLLGAMFRRAKHDARHAQHFRREHPSGIAGRTAALNSLFVAGGHQNATLAHLLQGGELEGVELISEAAQQLDAASTLDITAVQYTLRQTRPGRTGVATILRAISDLRGRGVDLTKARVRYRPPGRDKPETHTFDSIAELESSFVRRETVRFQDPIADRYERVEMRVMNALAVLADRERHA